jgi:CRP/FNR family transcriptional regulator, anaerobic regulatory protein
LIQIKRTCRIAGGFSEGPGLTETEVISIETIRVACRNCSLGTLCLPLGLESEDVERLDSIVKRARPLHRGDFLFHNGERFRSLYVVKTGSVKTYAPSEEGAEQVLGFHLPGEVIGLDAIDKEVHACTAKVLETSAICEIPFARLEELSGSIPSLQHQMYRLLSKEIGQDTEMLLLLGKKSADERLAVFLLSISQRLRKRGLCPTDFYLSMSRHEIGNYLGLAVETISRLFTRFQDEGLLKVDRKHVELLDLEAMEAFVAHTPAYRDRQRFT